jgi:hypothetical protein
VGNWLSAFVLILATLSGGFSAFAHFQPNATIATKRASESSILLSLAMILGTAPRVFMPSVWWLRVTALVVSGALTLASIALMRRQQGSAPSARSVS